MNMSDHVRLSTQHRRYRHALRHALVALVVGATLAACGETQDPAVGSDESSVLGSSSSVEGNSPTTIRISLPPKARTRSPRQPETASTSGYCRTRTCSAESAGDLPDRARI